MTTERLHSLTTERRCPFCRGELGLPASLLHCGGCDTHQHAECWSAHGGCATHACAWGPGAASREPDGTLRIVAPRPRKEGVTPRFEVHRLYLWITGWTLLAWLILIAVGVARLLSDA